MKTVTRFSTIRLYKYLGDDKLPNPQWKPFFAKSTIGSIYEVMVSNKDGQLVMSNTEVEIESNSKILKEAKGDVLVVGLGLNVINDSLAELKAVKSVTTLEIDQILVEKFPAKHRVVVGDARKKVDEFVGKFDVVYFDAVTQFKGDLLSTYLKKGGKVVTWGEDYKFIERKKSEGKEIVSEKNKKE